MILQNMVTYKCVKEKRRIRAARRKNMRRGAKTTEFGLELRKIRLCNNEYLGDMAEKLGVTVSYLSAVETGKRETPKAWVEIIISKYGLDKESAEALKRAYEMSKKTIKIDIGDESQERKTLAISFARELKNLDNEQIADILSIFKEKED